MKKDVVMEVLKCFGLFSNVIFCCQYFVVFVDWCFDGVLKIIG